MQHLSHRPLNTLLRVESKTTDEHVIRRHAAAREISLCAQIDTVEQDQQCRDYHLHQADMTSGSDHWRFLLKQWRKRSVASLSEQLTRASQISGGAHAGNDRMRGIRRFYCNVCSDLLD